MVILINIEWASGGTEWMASAAIESKNVAGWVGVWVIDTYYIILLK